MGLPRRVVCDRGCAGGGAWAASRHSLLIVTADEDDDGSDNRIATIVSGPLTGVVPNTSTTTGLLRTERVVMCSWVRLQGQRQ